MTDKNYGATPEDWGNLQFCLGLGPDLLPVVSNPNAIISPLSKMKSMGKTPSQYNAKREVAGIAKWTDRMAEDHEIERWSKEPDYGICIQTRRVRALDIDVDDAELAGVLRASIIDTFEKSGYPSAIRWRANSGKCLFAFILEGDMPKRVMRVDGGIIEFLANGQQFVAHGTHPSGTRYEWTGASEFPTIPLWLFEGLWEKLEMLFAHALSKVGNGPRLDGTTLAVHDPMTERLASAGLVLGHGNDGQLFLECPWKHEHSMDSGETECAYFPAGTRGYATGHFKCLHASHMGKTNFEFEQALLGVADDFDDLPAVAETPGALKTFPLAKLKQDKNGIDACLPNLRALLVSPGSTGYHIVYDRFLDENMIQPIAGGAWRMIDDKMQIRLRDEFECKGFKAIGRELMRDSIIRAAEMNEIDSAQKWVTSLEWDGVSRIDNFFAVYFGGVDSPYTRAVARYIWTALPGRVVEPGIQADMMPIFVGDQGLGKSSAIRLMVPRPELFTELSFHTDTSDLARQMKGKLIAEVAELTGLHTRELEVIKAFVTRRIEEWIPKYMEKATFYPRRCLLIGTTNRTDILADTENRRFLPVAVGKVDVQALKRDMLQLWAEGLARFKVQGIEWQDAQTLSADAQQAFKTTDSWEEGVDQWLTDLEQDATYGGGVLRTRDILQDAIGMMPDRVKKNDEERLRKIMHVRGWKYGQYRSEGVLKKGWKKFVPSCTLTVPSGVPS